MFREKGFPATSMRDLAESVGIEAASLYNHIQSKSEILQQIIFRISDDCNTHIDELNQGHLSSLEKVESIIRFHIQMMLHRFEDYHVMINEWIHLEAQPLTDFINQRRNYVQRLESFISAGIESKEIKPILPYVAVLTILSAVRGLEFWHRSQKNYSPEELEENMVAYLIGGLKC
jgi:AcrR family transcriptional regulator